MMAGRWGAQNLIVTSITVDASRVAILMLYDNSLSQSLVTFTCKFAAIVFLGRNRLFLESDLIDSIRCRFSLIGLFGTGAAKASTVLRL